MPARLRQIRGKNVRESGHRLAFTVLVGALLAGATGCSDNALESPTAKRIKGLGTMFLDHAAAKSGPGPANEKEFRDYLKSKPDFVLDMNGVDPKDIDGTFKSLRDNEPFVVLYGSSVTTFSGTSTQVLAHEKTGQGGKRLVVYASTKVDHVDEAKLKELLAAKP